MWEKGNAIGMVYVTELLMALGIAHLADRPASVLSGGRRQRTASGFGLAHRPQVLVADEPNAARHRNRGGRAWAGEGACVVALRGAVDPPCRAATRTLEIIGW